VADIFITPFEQSFFKLFLPPLEKTKRLMAGPKPTVVKGLSMSLCLGEVGSSEEPREVGMSAGRVASRVRGTRSLCGEGETELLRGPSLHGACAFGHLSHPRLC